MSSRPAKRSRLPPAYSGSVDSTNQPHGRGTLLLASSPPSSPPSSPRPSPPRYQGRFVHGARHGLGTLFFGDGSSLRCVWEDDVPQGYGVYTSDDGGRLEGEYVDGELQGHVCEFDAAGAVVFRGAYVDNLRHGEGTLYYADGGYIVGQWRQGQLHGVCEYYYTQHAPLDKHCLVGRWEAGDMVEARFKAAAQEQVYRFDPSTDTRISSEPLLPEPFEALCVYAAPSTIPGANEGLFARIDLPADVVVSFYNGIRVEQEVVDARDWEENSNTITLFERTETSGVVLDVPGELAQTSSYCASLGHKANHSFNHNAKYDVVESPRFGMIKCVRTLRPIAAGEEITVHYGYNEQDPTQAPDWYRAALAVH